MSELLIALCSAVVLYAAYSVRAKRGLWWALLALVLGGATAFCGLVASDRVADQAQSGRQEDLIALASAYGRAFVASPSADASKGLLDSSSLAAAFPVRLHPDGRVTVGTDVNSKIRFAGESQQFQAVFSGRKIVVDHTFVDHGQAVVAAVVPLKGSSGLQEAYVAEFKASSVMASGQEARAAAISVSVAAVLLIVALVALVAELLSRSAALRVSEAQRCVQQAEIQEYMAEITQRNQDMAYHQSQLSEAYGKLRSLATTDGLTGLMNHRTLMDFLSTKMKESANVGSPCSVILMDIDNFKQVNDVYGHVAGDEVLRVVGAVLSKSAPVGSGIGRYGGEEFMLVLPGATDSTATQVAEEIRRRIQVSKTSSRPVTASVGVSTVYSMSKSEQTIVDEADRALYYSKRNGKNRVTHFGQGILDAHDLSA